MIFEVASDGVTISTFITGSSSTGEAGPPMPSFIASLGRHLE